MTLDTQCLYTSLQMHGMQQKKTTPRMPLAPHAWSGTSLLDTVKHLNRRGIELLVEASLTGPSTLNSSAIVELRNWGKHLDSRAYDRIARCPVLLVDLNFQQPEWWCSVSRSPPESMHLNGPQPVFTQEAGWSLLSEILLEARSIGRTVPHVVSLLFGMAPGVVRVVTQLSCEDGPRVTEQHARYLRPRWEDRRMFWRQLLRAAIDANDDELINVQLHCLALLGSELTVGRR